MEQAPDRSARPDDLRVFATVGVIIIHVASPFAEVLGVISPLKWLTACGYDAVTRPVVPLFFMLSGMLLIPRVLEPWSFLRRRASKLLFPFLVWSLIYTALQHGGPDRSFMERLPGALANGAAYHLWFVYVLLGAYLALPIVGPWARTAGRAGLEYFLVIWGAAICLGTLDADQVLVRAEARLFMGHFGYLVLGYYLSILPVDRSRWRRIGWALTLVGSAITFLGTVGLSYRAGAFIDVLFHYTTPNVAMAAAGILMLMRADALPTLDRWPELRRSWAECSYGVYLVHILVLQGLDRAGLSWWTIHPLVGVPLTALTCFVLSWLFVRAVRMLPYGDKLVG